LVSFISRHPYHTWNFSFFYFCIPTTTTTEEQTAKANIM